MNETSAATVTTAGDMTYADAANSMGNRLAIGAALSTLVADGSAPAWRKWAWDQGDASYSATSTPPTTYQGLDDTGWGAGAVVSVTVTTGTGALVIFGCRNMQAPAAANTINFSVDVTGATTDAASDSRSVTITSHTSNEPNGITGFSFFGGGLTAGSNTFELMAKATDQTTYIIRYPRIMVLPL